MVIISNDTKALQRTIEKLEEGIKDYIIKVNTKKMKRQSELMIVITRKSWKEKKKCKRWKVQIIGSDGLEDPGKNFYGYLCTMKVVLFAIRKVDAKSM